MTDYPLPVKIFASVAIVLVYLCLPLFGLVYAAGAWADWRDQQRHHQAELSKSMPKGAI